ncbi:MAG: hypothetical protein ACTHU0_37715 [Kofleriaceae bacterium]
MAEQDASKSASPPKPVHVGGDSLVDRILPHLKKIMVGMILLAVVLSVFFAIRWWRHRGDEEATAKLASVNDVAQRPIAAPGATPDPANPTFADSKERAKAVLAEMAKTDSTKAGHAYRGGMLFDAGQIDDAIAEYKLGQSDKGIDGVLSREGLGLALEAKGTAEKDPAARQKLYEESLAAFNAMQPAEDGPRHAYALYHQGRLLQLLGKPAEAKAAFEKAKEQGTAHDLDSLIEQRLASLG